MKTVFKIVCLVGVLALFSIPIIVSILAANYISNFFTAANLTTSQVLALYATYKNSAPLSSPQNFLILGLDNRADALETTTLTDSIIFASYSPSTATITLTPLPRDLWLPELKTKINALYYYGLQNGLGTTFVTSTISAFIGQPIHHYAILDYQHLPNLIDLVGGIDIIIPTSFSDPTYPNPAYITDPQAPQYITINFTQGPVHLNGDTTLQFVRSRTSTNPDEAGDTARNRRQLLVIQALLAKLTQPELLRHPSLLGQLYAFYHSQVNTDITDLDLLLLAQATWTKRSLTLRFSPLPETMLINPPLRKYGQWVWELRDPTGLTLKTFISSQLNH